MHVKRFLHKILSPVIHKRRLDTLSEVIGAAIQSKNISLTALGRSINLPIQERSGIQKVNRLLGNKNLLMDYCPIAKTISYLLISNKKHPIIIVDWTKYPNSPDAVLRAAIEIEGRAITVYEERHLEIKIGNEEAQTGFLINLKNILPENCNPIIVTDAGFHVPWFQQILELNWDYIGRTRGKKTYQETEGEEFKPCNNLYKKAQTNKAQTNKEKSLGIFTYTQTKQFKTNFYLAKFPAKNRKAFTCSGKWRNDKDSKDYARANREPWLLLSSLSKRNSAKKVVAIYKRRMGIEEAFRDLKSSRYGFSLRTEKTKKKERRDIILLLAMLASLIVMLTGIAGEERKLQYHFQSNSTKHRRVVSIFYLGCQLIRKKYRITIEIIWEILKNIQNRVIYA